MERRRLGGTGIEVSALSLGGLFTSSLGGGASETERLLIRAAELGIDYVDTAPAYADSERTLGEALRRLPRDVADRFAISTKLGGRPQPFDPRDRRGLTASFEESLRLLGRERVDVLFIHEPDRPGQYDWWSDPERCEGPALDLMRDWKAAGRTRAIGIAGTTTTELSRLAETGHFDVVLTAFNHNSLYREANLELIPTAKRLGMGIVLGSALGQGFLGRRFDREVQARPRWLSEARRSQFLDLYALMDESGIPAAEMALRFALGHPDAATTLIGPKTTGQLESSVEAAARGPLPADVVRRLDEIAARVPYRPFEEPMILPFGKPYYGPGMANLGAATPVGRLRLD